MIPIFSKIKFPCTEQTIEEVLPCSMNLCDGSGLRETATEWFGGLRFVKCECRKQKEGPLAEPF